MRTTVTLCLALALALAGVAAVAALRCPDGTSECPRNATCCVTPGGAWGCCPMPQVRARPRGRGHRPCVPASPRSTPGWRQAVTCGVVTRGCPPPAQAVCCSDGQHCCPQGTTCDLERSMFGDVKCDDEMSCPDGNTCCRLSSGAWGCCPLEQVPRGVTSRTHPPGMFPGHRVPPPGVARAPGGVGAGVPVPWLG
uniref:Granulins domain-containing protein n=1 Tax=Anser cygnoides TaxID=8845 RepID=A0A8B9E7K6_ANSCY